MSQAQLAASIDTIVDTFARLVASARAGDTSEADRPVLDTLSQKLLVACSSLLDLTAELKHAAALASAFQLQGGRSASVCDADPLWAHCRGDNRLRR